MHTYILLFHSSSVSILFFIPKAAHHHLRKQHKHLSLTHHHFFDLLPISISKTSIFLLLSSFQSPYFQPHVLFFYLFIGRFMKFIYVLTFFNLEL